MSPSPIEQGQLTYWLETIANAERASRQANGQATGQTTDPAAEQASKEAAEQPALSIPAAIIEALLTLRCIVVNPDGHLHVTDKGHLSLRMSDPAAIHLR